MEEKKCYCGKVFEESDFDTSHGDLETYKTRAVRRFCFPKAEDLNNYQDLIKGGDLIFDKELVEHNKQYYCLMHLPDNNKFECFNKWFKAKFEKLKKGNEKFSFRGYWFPKQSEELLESCFRNFTFNNEVSFRFATFNSKVNFNSAEFKQKVSFWGAKFEEETLFTNVEFGAETTFTKTDFKKKVRFWRSRFKGETFFYQTYFGDIADFSDATFSDYVIFRGRPMEGEKLPYWNIDLEDSRFEQPEQTIFQSLRLHPTYFISHQPRKFVFVDVHWENSGGRKEELSAEIEKIKEIKKIEKEKNLPSYLIRLLDTTCLQLATNAEENSRYKVASNFRRMAFELERLDRKENKKRDFLDWLYRWTSGYGENWSWALVPLLAIWIIFTFLYAIPSRQIGILQFAPAFVNSKGNNSQDTEPKSALKKKGDYEISFQSNQSLNNFLELIAEAGTYSLGVLTLQKPEPSPANWSAKLSVMIETILGPLQLALLALAIRRKFMR